MKAPQLRFFGLCAMLSLVLPINGQAVGSPVSTGALLGPLISGKGGCHMVTYSDLIQTGILIVGIIALFMQANKKK